MYLSRFWVPSMSYTYLLDLYNALEKRMLNIEAERAGEPDDQFQRHYHAGRRDCLQKFHSYLHDTLDHKLPRRLQHQHKKQTGDR